MNFFLFDGVGGTILLGVHPPPENPFMVCVQPGGKLGHSRKHTHTLSSPMEKVFAVSELGEGSSNDKCTGINFNIVPSACCG